MIVVLLFYRRYRPEERATNPLHVFNPPRLCYNANNLGQNAIGWAIDCNRIVGGNHNPLD